MSVRKLNRNYVHVTTKSAVDVHGILKYAELDATHVFNWVTHQHVTCWHQFPQMHPFWRDADLVNLRQSFEKDILTIENVITGHYNKLKKSILKDGFKNPILCVTGVPRLGTLRTTYPDTVLPPNYTPEATISAFCFGGSRLAIAQELGMTIPCMIYDFSNYITNGTPIRDVETAKNYFDDSYKVWTDNSFVRFTVNSFIHQPAGHVYSSYTPEYKQMRENIMTMVKHKYEGEINDAIKRKSKF